MSFAEVAAKAGDKVDKTQIEVDHDAKEAKALAKEAAENAKDSVDSAEAKIQSTLNNIKKDLPKYGEDGKKIAHDTIDKVKKDLSEGKNALHKLFDKLVSGFTSTSAYVIDSTKTATYKATEELKNPIVATQTVVTIGAIAGLIVGVQERAKLFRNKTDGEITAILAGLAGFVVLDGYWFVTNYGKYNKKTLK